MTTRDRILLSLLLHQGKSSYQKVYSFLPPQYDRPNFYGILRRMEGDQLIKRSIKGITSIKGIKSSNPNGTYSIRLGPDALPFLESRFGPRLRSLLSPNSSIHQPINSLTHFSLVIYDFPLSMAYHRARLQIKLEQLGMGMLRKGVYASLYDVLKAVAFWAEENKILDNVYLLRPDYQKGDQTFQRTADRVWPLSQISRLYLSLLDRLAIVRGQQIPQKRVSGLRRIKSDFLELVSRDPMLPRPLLPPDWPMERVRQTLTGID